MAHIKVTLPALVIALLTSVGCQQVSGFGPKTETGSGIGPLNLEPLYGIAVLEDRVIFKVKSNGCTKPEHFDVTLEQQRERNNEFAELRIRRTIPDRCRRKPKVIEVSKTLDYSEKAPRLPIKLINSLYIQYK